MEAATTTMTSQLTGSDEREKRKKERARIEGDCTADEGLLSAQKVKLNVGSNFSHAVILSPPLATWPSPTWLVSPCPFTLSSCNCHHLPAVFGAS